MKEGEKYFVSKCITRKDISRFAGLCLDFNPVHTKRGFFRTSPLAKVLRISKEDEKKVIAHGLLSVSLVNSLMLKAGGPGTLFIKLGEVKFLKPVFDGDIVTAALKIDTIVSTDKRDEAICQVSWTNQRNEEIISSTQAVFFVFK